MLVKEVVKPTVQPTVTQPVANVWVTGLISEADPILGPSVDRTLVLEFSTMDSSYATGATLNLDFVNVSYQRWELPTSQGLFLVQV